MLSQQEILKELSSNLRVWKKEYGIKRIGLFGSYSHGEQRDSSDIDLIVEFEDKAITFDNFMNLKFTLEGLFQKPIDLVIMNDIKPALRPNIIRSAKYAEES